MLRAAPSRTASPWVALAVLSTAMLMIILDGTIVSVALPALRADLGFTDAGLSWTVNAYLIPLGGLLLLAGRLGDLVGRRRILVAGLVLFVLASLACGLATGPGMLVAARAVQGVAAALASSVVLGMVVGLFENPGDRARAMGAYAFVGAAGASIGLLLGGVLTEALSWRAIFLVNVPIGVVAILLVLRVLPRDAVRAGEPARPARGRARHARPRRAGVRDRRAGRRALGRRRAGRRPARRLRRPPGPGGGAAGAAAGAALAGGVARQPRPGAHRRRDDGLPVRDRPVPAAGARVLAGRHGGGDDAGRGDHRGRRAAGRGAAHLPVHRAPRAARRARAAARGLRGARRRAEAPTST